MLSKKLLVRKNLENITVILFLIALMALSSCSIGIRQEITSPPDISLATPISEQGEISPADPESGDQPGQTAKIDPTPVDDEAADQTGSLEEDPQTNILRAFPPAPQTDAEILLVFGRVVDTNGDPIPGASVEFWQTDANGIYDHPGDSNTESRDRNFQFYGTSVADQDGNYRFRTTVPGEYEPRPAHIHVKVRLAGAELLTTQFYFEKDAENVQNESVFRSAGEAGENLFLITNAATDANGAEVLVAKKDIVINNGGGGELGITPGQAEGPYYPRVNVSEYDNDLLIVD